MEQFTSFPRQGRRLPTSTSLSTHHQSREINPSVFRSPYFVSLTISYQAAQFCICLCLNLLTILKCPRSRVPSLIYISKPALFPVKTHTQWVFTMCSDKGNFCLLAKLDLLWPAPSSPGAIRPFVSPGLLCLRHSPAYASWEHLWAISHLM